MAKKKAAARAAVPTLRDWFKAAVACADRPEGLCEQGKSALLHILLAEREGKSVLETYDSADYDLQEEFHSRGGRPELDDDKSSALGSLIDSLHDASMYAEDAGESATVSVLDEMADQVQRLRDNLDSQDNLVPLSLEWAGKTGPAVKVIWGQRPAVKVVKKAKKKKATRRRR